MMNELESLGMHAGAKPEIFQFAKMLRANMTKSEKKLWEFLRLKPNGFKFRRQHPFNCFILDFYCHKAKLTIEIDGKYHEALKQKMLDESRTNQITQFGLKELRFTDEAIVNHFDIVKHTILDQLKL